MPVAGAPEPPVARGIAFGALPVDALPPPPPVVKHVARYGEVNAAQHRMLCRQTGREMRIYFNGEDVTDGCVLSLDGPKGFVEHIMTPELFNEIALDNYEVRAVIIGSFMTVRRHGLVEITPRRTP